jgi:hypothetical protein
MEKSMSNNTKIALAAALLAVLATPVLAQESLHKGRHNGDHTYTQAPFVYAPSRLTEGRNAAVERYGNPLVPDRESVIGN